ncbi:hypothetical protein MKW94_015791 [Papaver nudicaule]|uniref:Uncharacterized protein n=1 Tax=Papaver nudicaule TaxID=74823 RepID=A0AA41RUF4_PAPNU|nr:hypothetical protein [Papaver nudicaule]
MGVRSRKRRRGGGSGGVIQEEEEKVANSSSAKVKEALKGWTCYHDVEKIVAPWVANAFDNLTYRRYKTRREPLRAKLSADHEAKKLTIAMYAAEISFSYARKTKYEMLVSFARMLSDYTVPIHQKKWIKEKLKKEERKAKEILEDVVDGLRRKRCYLQEWVEYVQNKVEEKMEDKLNLLNSYANDFNAGNFNRKKKEFELVEKEIIDGSNLIRAVLRSCDTFGVTFANVKYATDELMPKIFFWLPADNDQDLVQKWREEQEKTY